MDSQVVQKCENQKNPFIMKVNISNVVLTPVTCASLINEILKGLLYQKSQIPYPYSFMKMMVDKKRKHSDAGEPNRRINFSAANYFQVVSSAYDTVEGIMIAITDEFRKCVNIIKEVTFVFGATPHCPNEILTIDISSLTKAHTERNHAVDSTKCQKILRNLFFSEEWLAQFGGSFSCTNTYVYLKKDIIATEDCCKSQMDFLPVKPLTFSSKIKHIKIYLASDNEAALSSNCCDNLTIFEDENYSVNNQLRTCVEIGDCERPVVWYQFRCFIKGFKDCFINKKSASELW